MPAIKRRSLSNTCVGISDGPAPPFSAAAVGVGAPVGYVVYQRGICFVPDRRYQGYQFCNSANHDFFIELPEVFEATAATRDNQHIRTGDFAIRRALKPKIAAAIFSASPWTGTSHINTWRGKRSSRRCRISLITAPVGDVTTPITSGRNGGPFCGPLRTTLRRQVFYGDPRVISEVRLRRRVHGLDNNLVAGAFRMERSARW